MYVRLKITLLSHFHCSERPSRVSFDLAQEDGLLVDQHDSNNDDPSAATNKLGSSSNLDNTSIEVFLEPPAGGSTSDMSGSGSCHSSRCCCSSYVCSVCSPRGSIDNVAGGLAQEESASSANSIDIACPRIQPCKQLQFNNPASTTSLKDISNSNPAAPENHDHDDAEDYQNKLLEVSSKNTQTDIQHITPAERPPSEKETEMTSSAAVWQQNGKTAADVRNAVSASPNQQPRNNKPPKTHRILINLDDKNRFTEEVTV